MKKDDDEIYQESSNNDLWEIATVALLICALAIALLYSGSY